MHPKTKQKLDKSMKKVFLTAALVMACTTASLAQSSTTKQAVGSLLGGLLGGNSSKSESSTSSSSSSSSTTSTAGSLLGGLLGGGSSSSTGSTASSLIGSLINGVIGGTTFSQADLCASTWKYSSPGCAFTTENLLAKAGGEIVSTKIEKQLNTYYQKVGFSSSNTYFKFETNGSFTAKVAGKSFSGTYTFDESTHAIKLKSMLLLTLSGYATKTSSGMSLLFESKKLLTLLQTLTALSGNSTLSTIGNLSKNYDGVRIGFDMTK